jgi:hypothetical protein
MRSLLALIAHEAPRPPGEQGARRVSTDLAQERSSQAASRDALDEPIRRYFTHAIRDGAPSASACG